MQRTVRSFIAHACAWLAPVSVAQAHPDITTPKGSLSWLISAVLAAGIVAAIWWSTRPRN
ncbi:MAG: hypothetical protein KDJ19_07375 [Hyphomicrobiaceae bacterium]|nr:hypothetical protein [Hyphomicrobiaceae bacterium]MCC0024862.1 hypothetical protein [Hyphomicrobiaceae bacterium]